MLGLEALESGVITRQLTGDTMEFTLKRNTQIVAYLLLALVVTQAVFTALYQAGIQGPRPFLWGLEAVLFTILAAFALSLIHI